MTALTILTTEIRQLDGLFSLNDLHKAAGADKKHQPANFIRLDTTQAMIEELCSSEMRIIPTKTITGRGKAQGTYVCRELVYAYAMWISAKFSLVVIRAFDALHSGRKPESQIQPSPPLPQAVVHLPGEQYAVITEGLGRVMDLFHPHSQPFINLLGVKRALAGISPQGIREPRFVIVAPGDSALSQPSGAPEGALVVAGDRRDSRERPARSPATALPAKAPARGLV